MHQLLPPSSDCRRLGHSVQEHRRMAGTGKVQYCAVCTLGYETALTWFDGDEDRADAFVRSLRAEQ